MTAAFHFKLLKRCFQDSTWGFADGEINPNSLRTVLAGYGQAVDVF